MATDWDRIMDIWGQGRTQKGIRFITDCDRIRDGWKQGRIQKGKGKVTKGKHLGYGLQQDMGQMVIG